MFLPYFSRRNIPFRRELFRLRESTQEHLQHQDVKSEARLEIAICMYSSGLCVSAIPPVMSVCSLFCGCYLKFADKTSFFLKSVLNIFIYVCIYYIFIFTYGDQTMLCFVTASM